MALRLLIVSMLVLLMPQPAPPSAGTITIDASSPGHPIPPNLYGIFFEEISHAGDGGLYAELIQNRGFEDARLPSMTAFSRTGSSCRSARHISTPEAPANGGCAGRSRRNARMELDTPGGAACVDATGGRSSAHRGDTACARGHGRRPWRTESADGSLSSTKGSGASTSSRTRNTNSRFTRGVRAIRRTDQAVLETCGRHHAGARAHASAELDDHVDAIRNHLKATRTDPRARLALSLGSTGRVWIDFVSLFPKKTWKNRPNGLRVDIAQQIADLKPGFVRWPGGCFAEGINDPQPAAVEAIYRPPRGPRRHLQPLGLLVVGRLRLPRVPSVQRGSRRRRVVRRQRRRLLFDAQRDVPA